MKNEAEQNEKKRKIFISHSLAAVAAVVDIFRCCYLFQPQEKGIDEKRNSISICRKIFSFVHQKALRIGQPFFGRIENYFFTINFVEGKEFLLSIP